MTLIAVYEYRGVPVILADVVLSTEYANLTMTPVPSVHDMHRAVHISGLVQKIFRFGPNLVLAWAGGVLNAKAVVDALVARVGSAPIRATTVQDFLSDIPEAASLQIVGICINERRKAELIQWRCHGEVTSGSRIFAGGTGYREALNVFRVIARAPQASTAPNSDVALTSALTVAATLIHSEADGFPSLQRRFGGAYQVAFSFKRKIELLTDWTLISWRTGSLRPGHRHLTFDPVIFRFAYNEDCLLVRRIHMICADVRDGGAPDTSGSIYEYLYEIGSLRTYPDLPRRLNPTFPDRLLSSFQVHVFELLPGKERLVWLMPIGENLENAQKHVELRFKEEPGSGSRLTIPSEFWAEIRQHVFPDFPNLYFMGVGKTRPEDIPPI